MKYAFALLLIIFCPWHISAQINVDSIVYDCHYRQQAQILPAHKAPSNYNDTLAEVYHVFETFFRPENFIEIAGSALSKSSFDAHSYILVQNSIGIYTTPRIYYLRQEIDSIGLAYTKSMKIAGEPMYDHFKKQGGGALNSIIASSGKSIAKESLTKRLYADTIKAFFPNLQHLNRKVIYHTPQFDTIANSLLGNKYVKGRTRTFELLVTNASNKKDFDKVVQVWYKRAGDYWQLTPHPVISAITFDGNIEHVWFKVSLSYRGAEVVMKKTDGQWAIVSIEVYE